MKKIKFFANPTENLGVWLNAKASRGYRLKAIKNFIYEFEKTDEKYSYATQYVGANPSKENNAYIKMLAENGRRIFRAPMNQGKILPSAR